MPLARPDEIEGAIAGRRPGAGGRREIGDVEIGDIDPISKIGDVGQGGRRPAPAGRRPPNRKGGAGRRGPDVLAGEGEVQGGDFEWRCAAVIVAARRVTHEARGTRIDRI